MHHAIWRIGDQPAPLASSRLSSEQQLEDMIVRDPRTLSSEWMSIGRQEISTCATSAMQATAVSGLAAQTVGIGCEAGHASHALSPTVGETTDAWAIRPTVAK